MTVGSKRKVSSPRSSSPRKVIHTSESFNEVDLKAVNNIRVFAAEMVQRAKSGHPGAPMGCAPMAHVLFSKVMRLLPSEPRANHPSRDKFILSNGHACALLYTMLYLMGDKQIDYNQIQNFRQLNSLTAGHPESHLIDSVEVTTGPLGQGIANAVGIAIADKHLHNSSNNCPFVYTICGDGCLMEGVSYEAISIAGHLKLNNLIVLFDDNGITIDGPTDLTTSENQVDRFKSAGWSVLTVENGDEDLEGIHRAILEAQNIKDSPTLICVKTTIGYGCVSKQGKSSSHGSPLGDDNLVELKKKFNLQNESSLHMDEDVINLYKQRQISNANYFKTISENISEIEELPMTKIIDEIKGKLGDEKTTESTRKYGSIVLNKLSEIIPSIMGGSADLAPSNLVNVLTPNGGDFKRGSYENRYIRFGVREHAMVSICNGMASTGRILPVCSTFLNFVGYCWGGLRLSALAQHRLLFVATHDSIELGEDGPTHQPIEILPLLRSTPNMCDFRPCDLNETIGAFSSASIMQHTPSVICLSRSGVPCGDDLSKLTDSIKAGQYGGYVLKEEKSPKLTIVSSGTEMGLSVAISKQIDGVRLVSLPSWHLFDQQTPEYRREVLGSAPIVFIEASQLDIAYKYGAKLVIGMSTFGASGKAKEVQDHFGFSGEKVIQKLTTEKLI